jgi:hypothetical protein
MKYTLRLVLLFGAMMAVFLSCSKQDKSNDSAVAVVGEKRLLLYDLEGVVPSGTAPKDSLRMIEQFIKQWVFNQWKVKEAEEKLSTNKQDLEYEIEQFKQSLLLNQREKELLSGFADTSINSNEIDSFYNFNTELFLLENDIWKGRIIRCKGKPPKKDLIIRLIKSASKKDQKALEELCFSFSDAYDLNDSTWKIQSEAFRLIPEKIVAKISQTSNGQLNTLEDSISSYFVYTRNCKRKGEIAPKEYEYTNIRNLLILQRKRQFLDQYYTNGFNKALKEGTVKISH